MKAVLQGVVFHMAPFMAVSKVVQSLALVQLLLVLACPLLLLRQLQLPRSGQRHAQRNVVVLFVLPMFLLLLLSPLAAPQLDRRRPPRNGMRREGSKS